MKQIDKETLLRDLCARLPYGVIVETPKGKGHVCDINLTIFGNEVGVNINPTSRDKFNVEECKPYLFPLSSMNEEQRIEYDYLHSIIFSCFEDGLCEALAKLQDWLNKNHFDYRNLIERNIAIDCTNLNIY